MRLHSLKKLVYRFKLTLFTMAVLAMSVLLPYFSSYAPPAAPLGAGVTLNTGVVIRLSGDNTNMTLANNVMVDGLTVAGTYALLNGSLSPPTYILNAPFAYDSSGQYTNVSSRANTALSLTVFTGSFLSGVQVRNATSYLTDFSSLAADVITLQVAAGGNTSVYVAAEGQPNRFYDDGVLLAEGAGWTYDAPTSLIFVNSLSGNLTLDWSTATTTTTTTSSISAPLSNLFGGNLLSAIFSPLTSIMGFWVFAILFGVVFAMIWFKTQNALVPSVTFILISPIVLYFIPSGAAPVYYAFLAISVAAVIYQVYTHRGG